MPESVRIEQLSCIILVVRRETSARSSHIPLDRQGSGSMSSAQPAALPPICCTSFGSTHARSSARPSKPPQACLSVRM